MKTKTIFRTLVTGIVAAFSFVAAGAVFDLDYTVSARATPALRLMKSAADNAEEPLDEGVLRQVVIPTSVAPRLGGTLQVGDDLEVVLFDDRTMTLHLAEQTPSSVGVISFLATADGYDGKIVAVVVQVDGRIQIDIQDFLEQRVYSVLSSEERTVVREMDPHLLPIVDAPSAKVPSQDVKANLSVEEPIVEHGTPPNVHADNEGTPTVDILVAYDTDAATWAKSNGGISGFAETQVQKMNTAIANTGLDSSFRFRLVGVYEIGYSAGGDIASALYAAYNANATLNGYSWSGLRAKRDEVEADIVCVLVDNGYSYGTTGIGNSLNNTSKGFSELAYNACLIRAVSQGHTMTHEVGHNMGAGHAKEMSPDLDPGPQYHDWSSGYYFYIGSTGYHTIMAYNNDGYGNNYTAVPYFSSPNHKYGSVAVGDETHDNTRTLLQTFLETSKYRGGVVTPDIGVGTETESYTWETSELSPWAKVTGTASYDGVDYVRSAADSHATWMRTKVVGPATLTFYYKMYTYMGTLDVTCDGTSLFNSNSSASSWTRVTASIPSGEHVIRFAYTRSNSWTPTDYVWVDNVAFQGGSPAAATYTVTYKPGSYGSGSQQTATKTHGVALTLKGAIFTRTGHTQTGWSTSDGGSKAYSLSASYTANAAITLYPFWTATSTGPANDSFSSPTTISGTSGSTSGSSAGATMQASEPKPSAQSDSGASVWYKWTAPSSGTATFDTIGSGFDTVLAVYTGTSLASLTEVASDDDSGGSDNTSKLSFTATSGTTYRIAVYGYSGKTGSVKLTWSLAAPTTYTVTYKPGSYGSGSQQTATKTHGVALTLKGAIFTRTGHTQTGWSTSDGGSKAYSLSASYTANASITLYPYWTATSTGPANDSFSSPATITGASGSTSGSSVGATMQASEPKPSAQSDSGASVWYKWTAPSSGTVTFDTIGSSFDTVLAVYTGTALTSLSEVMSDDDGGSSGNTSKLTFQAISGTTYRIAIYGYDGETGNVKLTWSLAAPTTYTVTYKPGSYGSGSQQTATKTHGVALTLKGAIFTRTGHTQTGWSTSDGGSKAYSLSASYTANAAITLYPFWTATSTGPANDSFSSPATITGASGSTSGSSVGATMQASEPKPSAQSNSGASVWYKWTAPSSGTATFDTIGSGFDTVLAVYTGTSLASLTEVASDDDSGGSDNTSKLSFTATSGVTYRIAVYGYSGKTGSVKLTWSLAAPTTYTVTYKPGSYGSGSQQTATKTHGVALTLKGAIFTRTGYSQTGWATSDGGSKAYSLSASYTANASITLYPFWTATSTGPANDSFSSPTTITGASGSTSGSNAGATMQASEPKPSAQSDSGASVWYKWTAPSAGTVTLDTIGSSFDTVVAVYTGTALISLSEVESDDDSGGGDNTSKLTFQADSGTAYWIAVYGYDGETGSISLRWSLAAPPTYTVTYKPGANGSGSQQTATKTKDVALTLKGAIFTRTGYSQTGWATSDGGPKVYNLNASYTVNAAITLYPFWTVSSTAPTTEGISPPTTISGDVCHVPLTIAAPWMAVKAVTMNGAVYDGACNVMGIVQLKVGKPKMDRNNGAVTAKVTGYVMLMDGKKKSLKSVTVPVPSDAPIEVTTAVNGLGTLTAKVSDDGVAGSVGNYIVRTAAVGGDWTKADTSVMVDFASGSALPAGTLTALLPFKENVVAVSGKWRFGKSASVKIKNGAIVGIDDPAKPNLSGLKLVYTPRKGTFRGSFNLYALEGVKLKKYKVNVSGVVVDGVGYGKATCRTPALSWSVTVE